MKHIKKTLLHIAGWLLIILGIVGLLLPFLNGIILLVLGVYVLTLSSERIHRVVHGFLDRHPRIKDFVRRVEQVIRRISGRFSAK